MTVDNPDPDAVAETKTVPDSDEAIARSGFRRLLPVFAVVALVGSVSVAGWAYYRDQVAPHAQPALAVGDTTLSMGHLVRRMQLTGFPPLVQLEALAQEQIVAQGATSPPFSLNVTEDEVDELLRTIAAGLGEPLADDAYRAWFRDRINETGMSEEEFRGMMRNGLLAGKVRAKLAESIPTTAPQARILLAGGPTEEAVRAFGRKLLSGSAFASVLADPLVAGAGISGGEIGWMPCEALSPTMCEAAFALQPGWPSAPIEVEEGRWAVLVVAERDEAREVEPRLVAALGESAFKEWLARQREENPPTYGDPRLGWTSAMDAWARAQAGLSPPEQP